MYCTWLEYIRSCTEDPSQEFLVRRWLVHNHFICLNNSLEVVVHHLLIGRMISLDCWDGVPMVSALVYMIIHWIRSTVSHDIRISSKHDFTNLLYYIVSQPWENIKLVQKLAVALIYGWDRKLVIYSIWIESLLMKVGSNRHS